MLFSDKQHRHTHTVSDQLLHLVVQPLTVAAKQPDVSTTTQTTQTDHTSDNQKYYFGMFSWNYRLYIFIFAEEK